MTKLTAAEREMIEMRTSWVQILVTLIQGMEKGITSLDTLRLLNSSMWKMDEHG